MRRIYLDYNASTPIDDRLIPSVIKTLQEVGNPSSVHSFGRKCRSICESAREKIARFFEVTSDEIIFTSGGTEGASLLICGHLDRLNKGEIISSKVEHACVAQTLLKYQKKGFDLVLPEVGSWGALSVEQVEQAITEKTCLIVLMAVNNETGAMTDIEGIASLAHHYGIPFIVDGVAWLGKGKVSLPQGVTGAFFSGHKIYAPKGCGFCVCAKGTKLAPIFLGGEQERHRRAGTENLPGIVALAEALGLLQQEQEKSIDRIRTLRDLFESELINRIPGVLINGEAPRICNTSNVAFPLIDGESLLIQLDLQGIAVSLGSACAAGGIEPSRVLLEMGFPLSRVRSSLRFSLGKMSTEEEVHYTIDVLSKIYRT